MRRTPHVALYFHTYPLGLEPTSSYQHVLHFYYLENVPYRNDVVYEVWKLGFFTGTVLWSLIQ